MTADYTALSPKFGNEIIVVTNGVGTNVPIANYMPPTHDWFMGVYNIENVPVNYCVRVTEVRSNAVTSISANTSYFINSTNPIDYYVMNISAGTCAAGFEVTVGTGDVDLYVRNDYFPTTNLWQFRSARPGTVNETNVVDGSTFPSISPEVVRSRRSRRSNRCSQLHAESESYCGVLDWFGEDQLELVQLMAERVSRSVGARPHPNNTVYD